MLLPLVITIHLDPVLVSIGPIAFSLVRANVRARNHRGNVDYPKVCQSVRHRRRSDQQALLAGGDCGLPRRAALLRHSATHQPLSAATLGASLPPGKGAWRFYGCIFGVVLAILITCWRANIALWPVLDTAGLLALPAQGIGRIGNIVNGDVIGYPADLPWAFLYTHPATFAPSRTVTYHPAAVYELLGNVLIFAILWPLRHRFRTPGMVFALYLIGYSISQIVIFIWRLNEVVLLEPETSAGDRDHCRNLPASCLRYICAKRRRTETHKKPREEP